MTSEIRSDVEEKCANLARNLIICRSENFIPNFSKKCAELEGEFKDCLPDLKKVKRRKRKRIPFEKYILCVYNI